MWLIGFGVGLAFWPGLLSAAVAPRWALLAAGLPLVSRLDPRALDPVVAWVLGGFLAWAALSLIWTPDRLTGAHELFHLLILSVAALAVANAGGARSSLNGASIALMLCAVIAMAQFWGWVAIDQATAPPAGLFLNRDILAEFAAPLFVWLVSQQRWVLVAGAALPLLMCQSRVGLVTAAAGLMVLLRWRGVLLVGILAVGIMLLLGTLPISLPKLYSADQRWVLWSYALSDPRILGHGIGSFSTALPQWDYAHGELFQAFYELGAGAASLVVLTLVIFWRTPDRAERAVFVALVVEAFLSFSLYMPATGFLAFAMVGNAGRARNDLRLCRPVGRVLADSGVEPRGQERRHADSAD